MCAYWSIAMSDRFYADLPQQSDFLGVTDLRNFQPTPADWHVVLTDVQGSTKAVQAGRYKEVNMIGAASIVALLNISRDTPIPFVFGGDGATLLIPPTLLVAARKALLGTRELAQREFQLSLRVGIVPMQTVLDAGHHIVVAKVGLNGAGDQAMFAGGGLSYVEKLVKDPISGPMYQVSEHEAEAEADYTGLECRWQDIPSRKGETISLLIVATSGTAERDSAIYSEAIRYIRELYGTDEECCPVSINDLDPSFDPARLSQEAKIRRTNKLQQWWYTADIFVRNLLLRYFLKNDVRSGDVRWRDYLKLLVATSDFRKYDDAIRMVISGNAEQREQLMSYLEARYQAGELSYGIHVSDRATVTCVVFERMGRQVHFVDGADGGLTNAARDLKQRLKQRALV
jgi:hypothetical protein